MTFQQNTIEFLTTRLDRIYPSYLMTLQEFGDKLCDTEDIAIDNSAVLAVYGLRKSRDIDFLYNGEWFVVNTKIECHNVSFGIPVEGIYKSAIGKSKHDLIRNPENYFYAYGFKHLKLEYIREFKKYRFNAGLRRRKRLKKDIQLIEKFDRFRQKIDVNSPQSKVKMFFDQLVENKLISELVYSRFDFGVKYQYGFACINNIIPNASKKLYKDHLYYWNSFIEERAKERWI